MSVFLCQFVEVVLFCFVRRCDDMMNLAVSLSVSHGRVRGVAFSFYNSSINIHILALINSKGTLLKALEGHSALEQRDVV